MPYEETFYKLKNVVGYTGDLAKQCSSLYFESPSETKYGRITVGHQDKDNNGRGKVEKFHDFERINMYHDPSDTGKIGTWEDWMSDVKTPKHTELLHVEKVGGSIMHVSRTHFIAFLQKIKSSDRARIFHIIDHNTELRANGKY